MIKSICFIHCVNKALARTQMFGIHYMPVWAYTLAPHIKINRNINFELFDSRISKGIPLQSDIFLFSGINQDESDIIFLHQQIKKSYPKSITILGGPIAWSFDQDKSLDKLKDFDHIYIGDGENGINQLLDLIEIHKAPHVFRNNQKFSLANSLPMDTYLLDKTIQNYYGGIIEVSRGCPFLCEFCDIRIQLDNNKAHCKDPKLIIAEVDYFANKNITQILFACDNFIGDPKWAEEVCDELIQWSQKTKKNIKIYSWLTINLGNHPRLLEKMKLAGFDMLFIGVESFGTNQLLETAKVQNVKSTMIDSLKKIQSYGFVVVAGLIFGFDSEPDDVARETLDGIAESGLLTGDPSLLMALPGTPLYKRMLFSNRLRTSKLGLGGNKFCTNIKYLKSKNKIICDLQNFVSEFNSGNYQYQRLKTYYLNLNQKFLRSNSIHDGKSYIKTLDFLTLLLKNPADFLPLLHRGLLLMRPDRLYFVIKAFIITLKMNNFIPVFAYFKLWGFMWSNSILKYHGLKPSDFDIESVSHDFDYNTIIPENYLKELDEPIPLNKIRAQRKLTTNALEKIKNKISQSH